MSSAGRPEKVKRFKGNSGAECEDFIQTIREAAWKEGKLRDAIWMADFASLHFSGKALIWHSNLSPNVRHDWFKQEKALLERWPPPADESDDEEAEASIVPTPAAASLLSTPAGKSSEIGVLQFVPMSRNEKPVYIAEPDFTGQCGPTMEIKAALRLSWDRSVDSECRVLEWVGSGSKWLAIHWIDERPSFAQGSTEYARLTVVDPTALAPATLRTTPRGAEPFRIDIWKLSSEGRTTVVWKDGFHEIHPGVFRSTGYIYVAVDPDAVQKSNPGLIRGNLVFLPTE